MLFRVPFIGANTSSTLRVASRRQVKRFTRHPCRIRNLPEQVNSVPELKYKPSYVPETISWNGWSPAPGAPLEGLPFKVKRTSKGKQLPVYTDYKNGRTRVLTILRRFEGDETELMEEMSKVCEGSTVSIHPGRMEVKGNYSKEIKQWLTGLGF